MPTRRGILLSDLWSNLCRKEVDSPWSWIVCCCATIIVGLFFGMTLNFGILFPVLMNYFQETRERTAWVGSVGIACIFALGPVTSMLVNRFGCRRTALTGAIICVASLLLSSLPSSIALMYVAYSIPFGFGSSCLFVSSYVVISLYFEKRKAIATGIVASGTGTGVLVVAPLLQALLDNYDWRKTYRIMAGIFSVVCLLCLTFDPAVLKRKVKETEQDGEGETENLAVNHAKNDGKEEIQKKWLNFSIFKEKTFVVLTLAYTVAFLGQHAPRLHLFVLPHLWPSLMVVKWLGVKFAEDLGISADSASRLFIYIGITTFISRLLSGILCNMRCVNSFYVFMFGFILDGSSVIFLSQAKSYGHLIVFSFLYGLADGFVIGTFNILILYCVEPSKRASAFGVSALFYGITTATGPPLAGFMADRLNTYVPSFILCAVVEFLAAALLFVIICGKETSRSRWPIDCNQGDSQLCEVEENNEGVTDGQQSKIGLPGETVEKE